MNVIVATDMNWNIGNNGKLLFHIPEDMQFFKEKTIGNVVVMGRKTLESLPGGNPLPDRTNLVLTNSTPFQACGVNFYKGNTKNIESMFDKYDPGDIFICGGESIYQYYLPRCDKVYRTLYGTFYSQVDSSFPSLLRNNFAFKELIKRSEYKDIPVYFEEWENLGIDSYRISGAINDKGSVRCEFASKDGTTWYNAYGDEYDKYVLKEYGQIFRDGIPIETSTSRIAPGIYRSTACAVQSSRIAVLDGYGGSEIDSNTVLNHYKNYICKL